MHGVGQVIADAAQRGARPGGEPNRRVDAEQNLARGPGQLVGGAAGGGYEPTRAAAAVHRSDVAAPPVPVDRRDLPASAGEQQPARPGDVVGEQRRIGLADLASADEHGELGRCCEDGGEVHEVAEPEPLPGLGADEEHAAVIVEKARVNKVPQDRPGGGVEGH
jgi:hypothetical protein